jgi:inosine-uridine nucleoside N-ribohydrolase
MGDLFEGFMAGYRNIFFDADAAPIHDACAVLAMTHPHLFEFQPLHVEIQTGHGPATGAVVADRRDVKGQQAPNVRVAVAVDGDGVLDVIEASIRSY